MQTNSQTKILYEVTPALSVRTVRDMYIQKILFLTIYSENILKIHVQCQKYIFCNASKCF